MNRLQVFEALGVKPTNARWSWCALAPDKSKAIFTLWKDQIVNNRYILADFNASGRKRPGDSDQKKILKVVLEKNIPSYGIVCEAKDIHADTRKIKGIEAEYLIKLKFETIENRIFGIHAGKIHFSEIIRKAKKKDSGLMDIESTPIGNPLPDRAESTGFRVIRDSSVRDHVIRKANGKCEYCGKQGFQLKAGSFYLEAHHVISLAKSGRDTVDNVIALCADHHREAHFGANAEDLEIRCIEIIRNREWA